MSASIETRQQLQPRLLTVPREFGGLTLKQNSFCDHYIATGNPTDAVIKAGFTENRASAAVIGHRLLRNVKVRAELKRRLAINVASSDEVLENLTKIARADIADIYEPDGSFNVKLAQKRGKSRLIKTIQRDKDTGVVTKVELYSAHEAWRDLGKFHKLFTDRVETETTVDPQHLAHEVATLLVALAERSRQAALPPASPLATENPGPLDQTADVGPSAQPTIETTATVADSDHYE